MATNVGARGHAVSRPQVGVCRPVHPTGVEPLSPIVAGEGVEERRDRDLAGRSAHEIRAAKSALNCRCNAQSSGSRTIRRKKARQVACNRHDLELQIDPVRTQPRGLRQQATQAVVVRSFPNLGWNVVTAAALAVTKNPAGPAPPWPAIWPRRRRCSRRRQSRRVSFPFEFRIRELVVRFVMGFAVNESDPPGVVPIGVPT